MTCLLVLNFVLRFFVLFEFPIFFFHCFCLYALRFYQIELKTAPADFRFPTTNQTRHCFACYIEYHRYVCWKILHVTYSKKKKLYTWAISQFFSNWTSMQPDVPMTKGMKLLIVRNSPSTTALFAQENGWVLVLSFVVSLLKKIILPQYWKFVMH